MPTPFFSNSSLSYQYPSIIPPQLSSLLSRVQYHITECLYARFANLIWQLRGYIYPQYNVINDEIRRLHIQLSQIEQKLQNLYLSHDAHISTRNTLVDIAIELIAIKLHTCKDLIKTANTEIYNHIVSTCDSLSSTSSASTAAHVMAHLDELISKHQEPIHASTRSKIKRISLYFAWQMKLYEWHECLHNNQELAKIAHGQASPPHRYSIQALQCIRSPEQLQAYIKSILAYKLFRIELQMYNLDAQLIQQSILQTIHYDTAILCEKKCLSVQKLSLLIVYLENLKTQIELECHSSMRLVTPHDFYQIVEQVYNINQAIANIQQETKDISKDSIFSNINVLHTKLSIIPKIPLESIDAYTQTQTNKEIHRDLLSLYKLYLLAPFKEKIANTSNIREIKQIEIDMLSTLTTKLPLFNL